MRIENSNKPRQFLVLIVAVAIFLRLLAAFYMGDEVVALPGTHDQISYDALAQSLLAGRGYRFTEKWYPFTPANTPTAHWSFAYPLYLAGIYTFAGYHPLAARLVQAILGGALTCLLLYLIGRRVVDDTTGLVAAGLAAVYGYFIYYNAALMTETFFILSVLYALYLGILLAERPALSRWLWLGVALGLAALLRQTILLFIPFLLLWLATALRHKGASWRSCLIPLLVVGGVVFPFTIRNYLIYQQFPLLNSNAGYAFYASNNPDLESNWSNENVLVPVPDDLIGLNEGELNAALTRRGIETVLADPGRYFLLTLDKTREYFKFWPSSDSLPLSNLVRVFSFGALLPLMLLGLYHSLPHLRRFALLYLFIVIHTAIHLLSWPAVRYRLPVDAVLIIFAAWALVTLARRVAISRGRNLPPLFELPAGDSSVPGHLTRDDALR